MDGKQYRQQIEAGLTEALGIGAAILSAPPDAQTVSPSATLAANPGLAGRIRRKAHREARRIVSRGRRSERPQIRRVWSAPRAARTRRAHRSRATSSGGLPGDEGPSTDDPPPPLAPPVAADAALGGM